MHVTESGWTGEIYKLTIEIGAKEGQRAFNSKQLRFVLRRARQACPKLRPKPDIMHVVSVGKSLCRVELSYPREVVERSFRTANAQKIATVILEALQKRLPDL